MQIWYDGFDKPFLKLWLNDIYGDIFDYHSEDSHKLANLCSKLGLIKVENCKLDTLKKYFSIPGTSHDALTDARTSLSVYRNLFNLLEKSIKINQNNLITQFIKNERPIVLPVPLFRKREKERGYNQSEILGRTLAKKYKLTFCPDLLIRIKPTKPQAKLTMGERIKNIKKAFKVNNFSLNLLISQYPNILLVDDIWTTGITLRTCGNLLKRAGFKKVWGLTLAR